VAQQPKSGLGRLIVEVSRSHISRHTLGRTPLNEWSARRRGRYLHNTQQTQETNSHAPGGNCYKTICLKTFTLTNTLMTMGLLKQHIIYILLYFVFFIFCLVLFCVFVLYTVLYERFMLYSSCFGHLAVGSAR
jgi:hypothetical protein